MRYVTTPKELLDKGLWEKACEVLNWSVWIINEGLIDSEEDITLPEEQAKEIGLIRGED